MIWVSRPVLKKKFLKSPVGIFPFFKYFKYKKFLILNFQEIKLAGEINKISRTYSKRKKSENKEISSYLDDIKEGPSMIC